MSKILIISHQEKNRRLLAEYLERRYEVIIVKTAEDGAGEALKNKTYDLIILDGPALKHHAKDLETRKNIEAPVFLPALLITPRKDVRLVSQHLWRSVDELVISPIEKIELQARVEVLLRTRRLSLELEKHNRERLQESEARYERTFEGVAVSIWKEDLSKVRKSLDALKAEHGDNVEAYIQDHPDFVQKCIREIEILDINYATLKMFEANSKEELLISLEKIFTPEAFKTFTDALMAYARNELRFEAETVFQTLRGNKINVLMSIAFPQPDFPFQETMVSKMDITARIKAEEQKKKLEEQLNQAQKLESIGRLAGGVAHDFNNMLSVVLGYGELLLGELQEKNPMREPIQEIVKAGKRARDLTRQLLVFSRKQPVLPQVLDINDQIRNLEKMLRRLIGEDIDLEIVLAPNVSRATLDPGQLEQVLLNLVVNARDAMPKGGRLRIETANVELDKLYASTHADTTPGKYVMIAVSDTGCGMDKETISHIFEPFFTTKERGKGTGLGLSTVYGIVKQAGGNIWVYSEPGNGSTFKIYFPEAEAIPKEKKESLVPPVPFGTEHILVVEDDGSLRDLMQRFLRRLGYTVTAAANGEEALLLMKDQKMKPDLIITDVIMPNMSGKELIDRLKSKRPHLKALFMSGYPGDAIGHHGVLDADTPFIQKPFNITDLARKIRSVLDQSEDLSAK